MEIEIRKTVVEKKEIQFPCYVKTSGIDLYYYHIRSEHGCIQVCVSSGLQIQECNPNLAFHLDYEFTDKETFDTKFNEVLTTIKSKTL